MIKSIVTCDECGKQEGIETAQNWIDIHGREDFRASWDLDKDGVHACSQECAVKAFSKWLGRQQK